jgi:Protein of unknown function (DUF3349)
MCQKATQRGGARSKTRSKSVRKDTRQRFSECEAGLYLRKPLPDNMGGEAERYPMGLLARVSSIVAFLRAGYPAGLPGTGHVPLLALLPRRVTDDEITAIISKLAIHRRRPIDDADVGVEITHITDEMPAPDDIERVQHRLAATEWLGDRYG